MISLDYMKTKEMSIYRGYIQNNDLLTVLYY